MSVLPKAIQAGALVLLPYVLAACGGGGDEGMSSPRDESRPAISADEQRELEAAKVRVLSSKSPGANGVIKITAGGAVINEDDGKSSRLDFRSLPAGLTTLSGTATSTVSGANIPLTVRSYQGFRGGAVVAYTDDGKFAYNSFYGADTLPVHLPQSGKAVYQGIAFDLKDRGTLIYNVDFGAKQGEGRIEGISRYGTIELLKGKIDATLDRKGSAAVGAARAGNKDLQYTAYFLGRGAEELLGVVENRPWGETDRVPFYGTRGDIHQ